MCQNIHGVVDLNVHMITNCRKFFSLVGNRCAVFGLDLVRGASLGIKPPGDDNTVTIEVALVCFIATILEGNCNFRVSEGSGLASK